MKANTTLWLVSAAAIVLGVILLVERPYRASLNQQPDHKVFQGFNPDSVKAIQIRPKGKFDIRVEKTNGIWQIVRPTSHTADPARLTNLLHAIENLEWQTRVTPEELRDRQNPQEEFGFDAPQYSLTIEQSNHVRHVLIGANTVMGDQTFVQVVGGNGFLLVDSKFLHAFPPSAEAWRDPAVVPAYILTADAIEIRSSNKVFKLEVNATNQLWRITRPLEARANSGKINALLTNLAHARAVAFVADDPNLDFEKLGLPNTPAQLPELEITFLQGSNTLTALQIGASPTNNPGHIFIRQSGQNSVMLAPKDVFEPWRASHLEFRNRNLLNFPKSTIHRLDVTAEDDFALQRGPTNSWQVDAAGTFSADPEIINELLTALTEIQFNVENDVVTDFGPFGLDTPLLQLRIHGSLTNVVTRAEDPVIEQLRFGTNASDRVFLRRNDEMRVHSIHRQELELFPRAAWQLRNRQIWDFASSNVVSVTVHQHGKTRKLLRAAENEWSLAPGSQGVINPFSIEEAVHRLGQLRAVFWTARGEQKNGQFGFAEANHRVELNVTKGGRNEHLAIEFGGFSDFRQPYAAVVLNGQRTIFEFPLSLYLEFVRRDLSIVPPPLPPE